MGEHPDARWGLHDHGDRQVPPGCLDLAVNVYPAPPPELADVLADAGTRLAAYPDDGAAREAVAARHGVSPGHVLLTNGAAEAFWALAFGLRPRLAACVHPSFTAPEAALRAARVPVERVVRVADDGFALDPAAVGAAADCIVLGRPDNPTGMLVEIESIERLATGGRPARSAPDRVIVVDEAFAEFMPDAAGLPAALDVPGLVRVRSLTKVWGLAGLRVCYAIGAPAVLRRLAAALQPWPVSSLALAAVAWLLGEQADGLEAERRRRAAEVALAQDALSAGLRAVPGLDAEVWPSPANYVLLRTALPGLRERLLRHGIAVRRGETFPGLDARYVRVTVPLRADHRRRLLTALAEDAAT